MPPIALNHDTSILAVENDNAEIVLWNPLTGKNLGRLVGHAGMVNSMAFSPTGNRLVSASDDGTVRFWDCKTQTNLETQPLTEPLFRVGLSENGICVAGLRTDNQVVAWMLPPQLIRPAGEPGILTSYFAPETAIYAIEI